MTFFHEPIMSSAFRKLCVEAAARLLDMDEGFKFTEILRAIATRAPSIFGRLQNDIVGIDTIDAVAAFARNLRATASSIDRAVMDNTHLPGHIGLNTHIVEDTLRILDDDLMKIIPAIYKQTPETPSLDQPPSDELLSQLKTPTRPRVDSGDGLNLIETIEEAAYDGSVADNSAVSPKPLTMSPPKTVFETHFTVTVPTVDNVPSWNGQPDKKAAGQSGSLLFNLRARTTANQRAHMGDNPALPPSLSTTTAADPFAAIPRPRLPYLSEDVVDFGEPFELIVAQSKISSSVIIACNNPIEVEKIAKDSAKDTSIYNAANYIVCDKHPFMWLECDCDFPRCNAGCKRQIPLRAYKPEHHRGLRLYAACVFRKDPVQVTKWGPKNFYGLDLDCTFLENNKTEKVFYEGSDWVKKRLHEIQDTHGINSPQHFDFLRLPWVQQIIIHVLMARTWEKQKKLTGNIEAADRAANARSMMTEMSRRGMDLEATQRALSTGELATSYLPPSGGFAQTSSSTSSGGFGQASSSASSWRKRKH